MQIIALDGTFLPNVFDKDIRYLKCPHTIEFSEEFKQKDEFPFFNIAFALCYASEHYGKDLESGKSYLDIPGIRVLYRLEKILEIFDGNLYPVANSIRLDMWENPYMEKIEKWIESWREMEIIRKKAKLEDNVNDWIKSYIKARDKELRKNLLSPLDIEPIYEKRHPWLSEIKMINKIGY